MTQRLESKAYEQDIITTVLAQLKRDNYLSEQRYAEAFLRSRLKRGEAPWLAAQKAKQKGAQSQAVQMVLAELCEDYDDEQVCRELIDQRDPGGLRFDDERVWQRQARFLRNKGHNSATILCVLKQR